MACLLVPAAEAVIVSIVKRRVGDQPAKHSRSGISMKRKLSWLTTMLWGGALLLALEHIWHGEIIFTFPFLTAARNAADFQAMLHELATAGVGMAVLVTAVWGLMVLAVEAFPGLAKIVKPAESTP